MSSYQLQLLGGFSLTSGSEVLSVPSDVRRVLAFLALSGRSLPRSVVAGKLWVESTESHANGSLRSALWRLRRVAPDLVAADKTRLSMCPEVTTDVDQIMQAANTHGDPGIGVRDASGVDLDLFRQELLPGWYDEWIILERERLRQHSVHVLESISRHLMNQHRFARAIDAAISAIGIDPLRETAHRALIAIFLAEGNRSEAVRHYSSYSALLSEQLGIEPSPALRSLVYRGEVVPDLALVPVHSDI